jgi:hypothetical protein
MRLLQIQSGDLWKNDLLKVERYTLLKMLIQLARAHHEILLLRKT